MTTFLFEDIIFGPVSSRRLGVSLGINLVPVNRKVCTFNCIYCECGWTSERHLPSDGFPPRELIAESLREKLAELINGGILPDALTFAGNGEPTLHPEFHGIILDTVQIREEYAPESHIAVLSNASLANIINNLKLFEKNLIIQTLFIRGTHEGINIDNTTQEEISALLELYWEIRPDEVQVYTTARDTPISTLNKVPLSDLESIAAKIEELGIKNSVFP